MIKRAAFLRLEWGLSLGLIVVAACWAHVRGIALAALLQPTARTLLGGAAVGALLWLSIPILRRLPEMAPVWETVLVPFSRSLTLADVLVVAALSGISEEIFFRGVLLPEIGVVGSSALFGLLHAVNRVYAVWAALIGAAFALLTTHGATLVTPIAAHAVYNAGALLILRRS